MKTHSINKLIVVVILLVFNITLLNASNGIPWVRSIDNGIIIATKHKLPILVFVYSETCKYCIQSVKDFQSTDLNKMLSSKKIVPIAIKKGSKQLSKYNLFVRIFPTYFLLSSDGRMVAPPLRGYVNPNEFAAYLDRFVAWSKRNEKK